MALFQFLKECASFSHFRYSAARIRIYHTNPSSISPRSLRSVIGNGTTHSKSQEREHYGSRECANGKYTRSHAARQNTFTKQTNTCMHTRAQQPRKLGGISSRLPSLHITYQMCLSTLQTIYQHYRSTETYLILYCGRPASFHYQLIFEKEKKGRPMFLPFFL